MKTNPKTPASNHPWRRLTSAEVAEVKLRKLVSKKTGRLKQKVKNKA